MSDDLRVDVYMPLYVRDFLTSTFGWTAEERGHYLTLLMLAWDRGGLPAQLDQIERLSPGVTSAWPLLADKFPVDGDGMRRNARLEKHRTKCVGLKEKRVNAAKRAAAARAAATSAGANAEQSSSNRGALLNHPTPTPTSTPTSTSSKEEELHTHTPAASAADDFRQAGWAAEEWAKFIEVWNQTPRAAMWSHLTAPDAWVDLAASPGWLDRARAAMDRLPQCEYLDRPMAVTHFFNSVDRILAGEFDTRKQDRSKTRRRPVGNL